MDLYIDFFAMYAIKKGWLLVHSLLLWWLVPYAFCLAPLIVLTTWPRKSQAKALWLMLSTPTFLWRWCWLIPNQGKGNFLNPFRQCTYFFFKICSRPLKIWIVNFLGETCVIPVFGYYSSVIIFFLNVLLHYDHFHIFNWKIMDWNCFLN